jgi:hypothetical protein
VAIEMPTKPANVRVVRSFSSSASRRWIIVRLR